MRWEGQNTIKNTKILQQIKVKFFFFFLLCHTNLRRLGYNEKRIGGLHTFPTLTSAWKRWHSRQKEQIINPTERCHRKLWPVVSSHDFWKQELTRSSFLLTVQNTLQSWQLPSQWVNINTIYNIVRSYNRHIIYDHTIFAKCFQ